MTAAAPTAENEMCLSVADGHKLNFIITALTKRTLQIPGIKPADRLTLLEKLNGMTDDWFTADMLAGIEPMDDTGIAIYEQARTLDLADDKTHAASFKVLATPSVFQHFVKLNPSIASAIEQRAAGRRDTPPPPPDEIPQPHPQTVMGAAQFAHMQRRSNGIQPTQHRSHVPPDQIGRMGGGLPDWTYDPKRNLDER
jgi:hypothetical protein